MKRRELLAVAASAVAAPWVHAQAAGPPGAQSVSFANTRLAGWSIRWQDF